jgi:predicted DNA-binding protein
MALSGLAAPWMAVLYNSIGTTHIVGDDAPENFIANWHKYMWGDAATQKLMLTGGDVFDLNINAQGGNSLKAIRAGGTRVLNRTDNVAKITGRLQKYYQDFALVEDEIEKNESLSLAMQLGRFDVFAEKVYSLRKAKMQEAVTSLANSMEDITAADPHFDKMENRNLQIEAAMSFFALVNEDFKALYGIKTATGITGGSAGTDFNTAVDATGGGKWTTKFGVDVTASKFVNSKTGRNVLVPYQGGYDASATVGTGIAAGLWVAIMKMIRETNFEAPPDMPGQIGTGIRKTSDQDKVIYTTSKGLDLIQSYMTVGSDTFYMPGRRDPGLMVPVIGGIPVERWEAMEYAPIYNGTTNTVKVTEGNTAADKLGPRFILHSRNTLFPVANKLNWFRHRVPPRQMMVPDLIGEFVDVEWTWFATDMRQQGILSPSTSFGTAY